MKNKIIFTTGLIILALSFYSSAFAANVSLTIRDGNTFILPTSTFEIVPNDTVLTLLDTADQADSTWSISDLQHYSFGDYVKCITSTSGEACDNWQYTVNNSYPLTSIDQNILSDGDNIYLYFGPQNKITLSSNNIKTNDTLTVTSQKYDYNNNQWETRTGVTVGLTQDNPDDPWSPIEVKTSEVNGDGQATFSAIIAGSYNIGIKEDGYFPTEALTVTNSPISHGGGGGALAALAISASSPIILPPPIEIKKVFDIEKAFDFLNSKQNEDGSFGEDIYTDWTTIALASKNSQKTDPIIKLIKYFNESKLSGTLLTDFERKAMALMSLGLNPYNTNSENYIKKITDSFDGKQFGDIKEDNDDIFALIVLQNVGYTEEENIIKNSITFILEAQKENGSWDDSIDMTGAAIKSLSLFSSTLEVRESLDKAKKFLKENQKDDGGFGNVSSTAWAIGGILALSEKIEDWNKNGNTPLDYLSSMQDSDGGIKEENLQNRIWQTAYATTALSGKTWNQIMQKFEKPKEEIKISKEQSLKNPPKTVLKKSTGNSKKLDFKKDNENTIINITSKQKAVEILQPVKKSWFKNFLEKIFSIF